MAALAAVILMGIVACGAFTESLGRLRVTYPRLIKVPGIALCFEQCGGVSPAVLGLIFILKKARGEYVPLAIV